MFKIIIHMTGGGLYLFSDNLYGRIIRIAENQHASIYYCRVKHTHIIFTHKQIPTHDSKLSGNVKNDKLNNKVDEK